MKTRLILGVWLFCLLSAACVPFVVLRYGYRNDYNLAAWIGDALLIGLAVILGLATRRQGDAFTLAAVRVGVLTGLLWMLEIGTNNFLTPPLPWRDWVDDLFWACIALWIGGFCLVSAWRSGQLRRGLWGGAVSGAVSGLVACGTGLMLIVSAMPWILRDPLNLAEWEQISTQSGAPSMAAYFAFQTLAGAFLHLTVLGLGMGLALGLFGGLLGKAGKWLRRRKG